MKFRYVTRILAVALSVSLLFGGCASHNRTAGSQAGGTENSQVSAKDPVKDLGTGDTKIAAPAGDELLTLGKAADFLLTAAAKYNKNLPSREELMDNFIGLGENDELPRLQALIMVSRAFGELPEPKGNAARLAPEAVDLSQVPEWAQEELGILKKGGVLAQSDLDAALGNSDEMGQSDAGAGQMGAQAADPAGGRKETLGADSDQVMTDRIDPGASDSVEGESGASAEASNPQETKQSGGTTGKDLKILLNRIYALYGTNLNDDFYTAVNQNALLNKEIPAGETDAGGLYDQTITVQKQVDGIIKEIVEGSGYAPGSREQKIKDFYESAVDFQKRNQLGAEPLRKYLNAIDSASNLKELSEAQVLSLRETASGGFLAIAYMGDMRDSRKIIPTLMPPAEPMDDEEMEQLNIRLLVLSGESEEEAAAHSKAYREWMEALAEYAPAPEDYGDPSKITRYVTLKELQDLLPGMDVKAIIEASGDEIPTEFCLMSPTLFEGFGALMQDEKYLPAIRTALKLNLLNANYTNLSKDFIDAFDAYNQKTMGQSPSNSTPEEIAYAMVKNSLGTEIDRLYAERYFSAEAKKGVEDMIKQFISVYKERIQKLDWMGEETKKAAIEKLDSMKFFIGYPDRWDDTLDQLEVTDHYFENQVAVAKLTQQRNREEAAAKNEGRQKTDMRIPVATVNAYYDQFTNTMCFPAGILQVPSYDVNASLEENLGGIGATIAHEITHAFDNNGAKYDKNGQPNNWWSPEDEQKFQELCGRAVAFYDGFEAAAGIPINGEQTLGENIADIGAVACALEVLKKMENPDYDKFFRAYAEGWLKCTTRARAESLAEVDEHSSSNLRVNRVLSNFQEFYDTYGIQPGDGMYVPAGDRIQIW